MRVQFSNIYLFKSFNTYSRTFQRTRAVTAFVICNMDYLRSGAGKLEQIATRAAKCEGICIENF